MNDDAIKTLLRPSDTTIRLRPADEFWGEFERKASAAGRETALRRLPGLPARLLPSWRAPVWTATAAAAAALLAVAVWPGAHAPALNQFQIGDDLRHNGALVITDSDTDATILWVITEET